MRCLLSACLALTVAGAMVPVSTVTVSAAAPVATQRFDIAVGGKTVCNDGLKREFPQMFSSPVIADLFHDGDPEVIAGFPDGVVRVYRSSNGAPVWTYPTGDDIAASPTVADLDGNGNLSVIISSYSGQVFVWDAHGSLRPGWPQSSHFGGYGQPVQKGFFSSVAVGDAFGDGRKELFASAIDLHTYAWFADGTPLPGYPHTVFDSALATPTLADLEHRHRLDIVTPADTFGGDPYGDLRGGTYWVWQPEGSLRWRGHVDEVPWASPAIADFGDGSFSIVNGTGDNWHQTAGYEGVGRYIAGFNGDGSVRAGFPSATAAAIFAGPAVGDPGIGKLVIVVQSEDGMIHVVNGAGVSVVPPVHAVFNQAQEGFYHGGAIIAPVDVANVNGFWMPSGNTVEGYDILGGVASPRFTIPTLGVVFSTPAVGTVSGGGLGLAVTSEENNVGCDLPEVWHLALWDLPSAGRSMPANAWPTFHGNNLRSGSNLPLAPPPLHGYWMVAADGGVFPFGNAVGYGSTGNIRLNQPIVGMARAPADNGYWLVASDGGIFPFGPGATGYGSTGGIRLNQPVVGMAAAPGGNGYWLVARDGGVFPFGPGAIGYGSTGNIRLNQPVVGMARTASGKGYWLVAGDGGIFPFGDAGGYGSTGNIRLNQPIVGMAATPGGRGYWLVASDGGIFPFGDAVGRGSTGNIRLNKPIVGMAATSTGNGYWLMASDGGIFPFGDAVGYGSLGAIALNKPVVGGAGTN